MIKKAVTHLSLQLGKPVLKLTSKDYNEHGMSDLLSLYGQAYDINIEVFNYLQHTITGWPGGKPNADDTNRPERAFPAKKKVIIFSPHPDDDIISMGGTFQRLHDQGHDVHVVYQTSGNIAVADDEALSTNDVISILAESRNIKAKYWKLSTELIKSLAKLGDVFRLPLTTERLQKLTESYVVSNQKIKSAIGKPLPVSAKDGLLKTFNSFYNIAK
jgi:glucosamine-6-phosphate deaminase